MPAVGVHLNQRHELVGREVRYTVCGLLGYDFMQDRTNPYTLPLNFLSFVLTQYHRS
jgi:hypothetical protein